MRRPLNRMTCHQKRDTLNTACLTYARTNDIRDIQEPTSCHSGGALKSMRLPLFVVNLAYAEGIEELTTSSKNAFVDPSELIVVNPSENEFHTRLEVE